MTEAIMWEQVAEHLFQRQQRHKNTTYPIGLCHCIEEVLDDEYGGGYDRTMMSRQMDTRLRPFILTYFGYVYPSDNLSPEEFHEQCEGRILAALWFAHESRGEMRGKMRGKVSGKTSGRSTKKREGRL